MAEQKSPAAPPDLNKKDEALVQEQIPISPHLVHETIVRSGERELVRSNSALAWSGLAAGFSMSLSFITEGLLQAHLPDAPWRPLLVSIGYPFGFLVVILARQQLFTENTLTAILPLMDRRNFATFVQVVRLWAIVLAANLTGAHIAAWVLGNTQAFRPEVQHAFSQLGHEAAAVGFGAAVLRGIFAGWIIALLVWILAAIESGEIGVIFTLTYLVALGGLTHIIAGSTEVLFLVMTGQMPWSGFLTGYMLPTLLGNSVGGVSLVSALHHAQIVADRAAAPTDLGQRA